MRLCALFAALLLGSLTIVCTPTIRLTAPGEPVSINLNMKIGHGICVKVDKTLDDIISENSGLFQRSGSTTTRSKLGITLLTLGISLSTMAMGFDQVTPTLGGAKAQGLIGEQADGYPGVASNSGQAADIAAQINAAHHAEYQKAANSSDASLADVEAMAGKRAMEGTPAGQYVQVGGKQVKKWHEDSASALGRCSGRKDRAVSAEFFLS